jgi:uncharacterized protein YjiS (DUF1127 family)
MARSRETALAWQGAAVAVCRIAAWLGERWRAHLRRRFHRQAVASLEALDDRMLADLGIDRSEIRSIARGRDRDPTRISRPR